MIFSTTMNPEYRSQKAEEDQRLTDRQQETRQPTHRQGRDVKSALADELTPAEHEEKEKARQEARAALASIFEALRQQPAKPDHGQVRAAIDGTPLQELKPAYKIQLESAIVADDPRQQSEQEFVERGLKVLSLWIHLQGLKRGSDRDLAELRAGLKSA